ncbi:MAG: SelB C-terminal domain-containing protein, partial [Verrucomicrobia bacterium]|nr:SelB C-terminal domain-containing protein [Verrucomicrobiota bacterium]
LHALRAAGTTPLKPADAAHRALVSEDAARTGLARLIQDGRGVRIGDRYAAADVLEKLRQDLAAALSRLHQAQPKTAGFTRAELRRLVTADPALADLALKNLADAGRLWIRGELIGAAGHRPATETSEAILKVYRDTGFLSPRPDELAEQLGRPPTEIEPVLRQLLQAEDLVRLSEKVILHPDHLEASRRKLTDYLAQHDRVDAVRFKEVLGTSKKYSIAILEYWDRKGLTRRIGDERVLANKSKTNP